MRILFLEDEGIVRAGIAHLIKLSFPEAELVDVGFGDEAIDLLNKSSFDVLVSDLGLKSSTQRTVMGVSITGIHVIQHCVKVQPNCKVVVLTGISGVASIMTVASLGVKGFLFKEDSGTLIKPCIQAVLQDKTYYAEQALKIIQTHKANRNIPSVIIKKDENEVLELLKLGYSTKEISDSLNINNRAVHYLLDKLYKKTGTQKNTELIVFASQNTVVVE